MAQRNFKGQLPLDRRLGEQAKRLRNEAEGTQRLGSTDDRRVKVSSVATDYRRDLDRFA
jgi:hypothetical protein